MASAKNEDIIKLIIKGQDEYSGVSEEVRQELSELAAQSEETQQAFVELDRALDLAATYREQEAEIERLAQLQAQARQEVDRLTKANKEANGENLKIATSLAKARAELSSYRTATNKAQKEFNATAESMRKMGASIEDVEANQNIMRASSERMAAELEKLRSTQDAIVDSAKEQAAAYQEQKRIEETRAQVLERVSEVYAKQVEETRKAREEQARIAAETEKLTTEIKDQLAQLERGEIGWQDYQRRVRDAGTAADLTRKQVAEINRAMEAEVVAARKANAELQEQKQAEEARAKAMAKVSAAYAKQVEETIKAREEQARVAAETEKLTTEIKDQLAQLERGEISWQDYQRRVRDAGTAADLTRKQVAEISRSMESQVTAAKLANQALREQEAEAKRVQAATEKYRLALEKLVNEYKSGKIESEAFEQSTTELRQKLNLTEDQVEQTRREMGAYVDQMERLPDAEGRASKSTDLLTKVTRRLAQAYTVLLAAQKSAQLVASGYSAYTESENAMLGLQKTTNLTASELNGLATEMQRLSTEVTPTTKAQLLEIAEAAGRMGIQGAENISAFTKSIDALTSATDLAGDETAQAVAQILNVTGEAQSNVTGVSAAIADLGNTSATTEEQIVHLAKRLASDTATVKLTSAEVLGLGAAMAEMGLQAEGSSTVIGRTFRYIADAIKGGGEPMEQLQRITGKTSEELEKAFGESKIQLFSDFVAGLGRMQDGGETLNNILSDMGIKSDENARILGLLSQRYENVNEAVERSNLAFEQGTAHFEEMAKKAASLESGFTKLQNKANALKTAMGEAFADDLSRAIDKAGDSTDELDGKFSELGEAIADIAIQIADMLSTLDGLNQVFGGLIGNVSLIDGLLTGLSMNLDLVTSSIDLMIGGVAELAIAWNKFWGDTEDVEEWTKVQEDAFARIDESVKRYNDNLARLNGESSRAFQDLRDTYNENRDALARMDEEQRKAVETIINSTGYIAGNDAAYRELTRAMQRAAEEKAVLEGATSQENEQIKAHVALLKAQGVEEGEAIRLAQEKAAERKKAAEAAEEEAKAERERRQEEANSFEALIKQQEEAAAAAAAAQKQLDDAYQALGVNVAEVTNSVTETGQKAADAFVTIATSAETNAEVVKSAFDSALSKTTTVADAEYLKEKLEEVGDQGVLSGKDLKDAYQAVESQIKQLSGKLKDAGDNAKDAKDDLADLADEIDKTGQRGTGSIGELTKAIQTLVSEVKKLTEGFQAAGDEAEKMQSKAGGGSGAGGGSASSDSGGSSSRNSSRSWASIMASQLSLQGRDDAAEILTQMIASGDTPSTPGGGGLDAAERWRESVVNEAISRADEIQQKYNELAQYQRDIAAGDVAAAKQLLERRNAYADLEADLVGIVTQASNLVNGASTGSTTTIQQPGKQVQAPQSGVYTVRFDFGGGKTATGQFSSSDGEKLLAEIASIASISR